MQIAGIAPFYVELHMGESEKAEGFPYVGSQMKVKEDTLSNSYT